MTQRQKNMLIGAVVGAIVGRLAFNGFEDMGMRIFLHGDLSLGERLQMALFSSGALKIWGGVIVGVLIGNRVTKAD